MAEEEGTRVGGQRLEVVAFDPVDVGYSHAMFNAAVLQALDAASMVERIHVVVAKSALESRPFDEVRRLDKVRVAGSLGELPLSRGRWREMKRRLGCYFQMARNVRWSRSVVCMYLASDNLIGPMFLLLDKLVRGRRAYVILHSNAQSVRKSLAIRLLWGGVFRVGVQPIVLAKWVYSFYTQVYPRIRFHLIPHPSYVDATGRDAESRVVQNPDQRFLFIGIHGMASTTVGFLRRFISECSAVCGGRRVTIVTERSVAVQVERNAYWAGIGLQMYDWPLEHDDYYGMVRAARFVVFPPEAGDRICASGVHADAISYCVPIIAPIRGVFRENVPDSGANLLYENVQSDLGRVVARATGMSPADYRTLRSDVAAVRSQCDVARTAERITHMLMEAGQ